MDEYRALADQLIRALQDASNATIASNNRLLTNTFGNITNQGNAKGTLYSTETGFRKTQAAADTTQKNADIQSKTLQNTINVRSDLLNTQRQLDAQRRATEELNRIQFDQFGAFKR